MPSHDQMLTARQKPTDIYSVMLILASVFLLFASVLIWQELDEFYDFWGTEGVVSDTEVLDDTGTGDTAPTPPDTGAGDAGDAAGDAAETPAPAPE